MPPRDQPVGGAAPPIAYAADNAGSNNSNNNVATSSADSKYGQAQEGSAGAQNSLTPTKGWRRNTFHWELNLYTFGFLWLMYQYAIPVPYQQPFFRILAGLVTCDAGRYYYAKGTTPGVPYTLPFVTLLAMLIHPVRFWAEMATIAIESGQGQCTNVLVGNFMIFVTDTALCREIMTKEGTYGIYAHPNALWLFGPKNLIYMDSQPHKSFRAILTPALFGKEALTQYAQAQERVCRQFLTNYATTCQKTGEPVDARIAFRAMAAASSQEAFLGPYLTDSLRKQLERDIVTFTMGFLSFPFPYFNSGLHQAIQAKNRIEEELEKMVPLARKYVEAGNEPRCLMERWSLAIQEAAKEKGICPEDVPFCTDDNISRTILDFLFAAQDATNSALAYSLDVLDEDRGVLDKMRSEIDKKSNTTSEAASSYIDNVTNQLLHHKPPVPMIPHRCKKATTFAGRHISAGTVMIPSITYSARTSGGSIHFLPERPDADALFVKTVTFGAGQHKCPGRRYAESLLSVFLSVLAEGFDFERTGQRPEVDDFVYYPTLFPRDCNFIIKKRVGAE